MVEQEPRTFSRRDVLSKGIVAGGVGAAAGILVTSGVGCAQAQSTSSITYDVACNGDTLRIQPTEGNEEGDSRGNTFYVEGWVYEDGTISGDGFDPESADPIGVWLCRGWFMNHPGRPNPHVITTQEYVLDNITEANLFPGDSLTSSGTEGSDTEEQPPIRAVIGGTGRYIGATGQVVQNGNGTNTTVLRGVPDDPNAPNFRFDFTLLLPEIDLDA